MKKRTEKLSSQRCGNVRLACGTCTQGKRWRKVFWFFFSKKNGFLPLALTLQACVAQQPVCRFTRIADVPLRMAYGHLLIQTRINDLPARMVFDTGASPTTVDQLAAGRLGLRVERPLAGMLDGVGGSKPFSIVSARSVGFGQFRAENFLFASTDTGGFRNIADGLLGSDFLSHLDIDLDLPAGRLVLYKPNGQCSRPAVFLEGPLYSAPMEPFSALSPTPRILVRIAGHSFIAAIDTGAPATVMTRAAAERLGLRIPDLNGDRQALATGIGPLSVRTVRHTLESVDIGGLSVRNMPVGILDQASLGSVDMLLGLDFQTRVHLWVSYSSRTLVMQYPPRPSPLPADWLP